MPESLKLITVHAHPDDESSKGPSTIAKLRDRGIKSVLVTCTGGEEGDIHNPVMDRPEIRENMHQVRLRELDRAVEIIGYEKLYLLGYRDSGMPDTPANNHPDSFARATVEDAADKLIRIVRAERPQVMVTYPAHQTGYPHPDHLKVHEISVFAYEKSADQNYKPELGLPHGISKLYYTTWSGTRLRAIHERFLALGLESPFSEERLERLNDDGQITTQVDIRGYYDVRQEALRAHATQIDPNSPFWFGLAAEEAEDAWPYDDYILARSRLGETWDSAGVEGDLFRGIDR